MDKLKEIRSKCNGGVYIEINRHRDCYEDVSTYIKNIMAEEDAVNIPIDIYREIVKRDSIIELTIRHGSCSYCVFHYDLDSALDIGLQALGGWVVGGIKTYNKN